MTTPEQPDDAQDPATGAGRGHSAPRPVPPLTPASRPESPASGTDADPDATSVALPPTAGRDEDRTGAPTRVSAFPAFGRSRNAEPSASSGSSAPGADQDDRTRALPTAAGTDGDDDGANPTTTTPVVAPGPAAEATTRIPTSGASGTSGTTPAAEEADDDATRVVPLADPDALAGSTNGRLRAGSREPLPDEDWAAEPTKRGGTHVWGVLGILVAAPVTWFLLTDGALRTFYGLPPEAPLNPAGLLSLAGGLLGLVIIAVVTRVTSLGSWIWGGVIALAGLAALVFPIAVDDFLTSSRDSFLAVHEGFGTNLHDYLTDTGRSGVLLLFGLVLLLLAFVSHGARRSGRYEGRVRAEREARGL
ncbi:hypothetical protein [Serinibacter arcticus]|uniref:Uncharacterized protein n=1 Tax=Serinibacter arcticus TaxID=1655435 RepID=A0A4Z1E3Q8_9MICO|nr:hypothetical protein [Serinibacter arcticus]TGO06566.1 hypothetical protein SERN_0758 [Serinibacter arcticus]